MIIEAWDPFCGGGQTHAMELCNRLIKNYNCNIDIYTRALIIDGVRHSSNYTMLNGKINIFRLGSVSKLNSHWGRLSWIISSSLSALSRKYDLIHGHSNLGGLPTWIIGKLTNRPTVLTVHGSGLLSWNDISHGIKSVINYNVEKFLQTDLRYTIEISVDSRFSKFKNINNPVVIPNGVDVKKFDLVKTKKESKYFKILYVGRLSPEKGLIYLIKAAKKIKEHLHNVKFVIIGDGAQKDELLDLLNKYKLNNLFEFKGKVCGNDLIKEFKSSHLFVLSSIFEGQPLTLLEAWAAKLPVLVTDVGDNKKFINTKNGLLVKSKRSDLLAKNILNMLNTSKQKLSRLGVNGHKLVSEKYTWDKMTDETHKVYESIIR